MCEAFQAAIQSKPLEATAKDPSIREVTKHDFDGEGLLGLGSVLAKWWLIEFATRSANTICGAATAVTVSRTTDQEVQAHKALAKY